MRELRKGAGGFGTQIALSPGISTRSQENGREFPYTSAMRFILVDSADARGCVALCHDAIPYAVEAHPADQEYSAWLLPAVRRLLGSCCLSISELDGYAVCSGPGSFTGLRVGLTTVKAWAEIYSKPIVAVSRLAAFALSIGLLLLYGGAVSESTIGPVLGIASAGVLLGVLLMIYMVLKGTHSV